MFAVIAIPLAFAIIGALIYLLATTNAKIAELGRIVFMCGFLVLTFSLANQTFRLGGH